MHSFKNEDEDIVRWVYGHSAQCSFGFGILFNVFLAWLILKRTPAPMRLYSKLLIAPVIMDFLLAIFTYLVQPIPVVAHGYFAIMQNGIFRNAPTLINYSANVFWLQLLLVFVCCTTIQFIFRHYMIISDGRIPTKLKWITSIVLCVLLTAHVVFHYLSDFPYAVYRPEMAELARKVHREVGLTNIRFASFTPARSILWLLHCAAMLGVFIVCYWIIVHCAIGTRRYIIKNYENCSEEEREKPADVRKNVKIREYNNQLTQALVIQAILPTIDVLELSIQTTLPIYMPHHGTNYFLIFAAVPLYFIPILNPLATMFLFKPYRRAVFKILSMPMFFTRSDPTSKATMTARTTPFPAALQFDQQQSTETTGVCPDQMVAQNQQKCGSQNQLMICIPDELLGRRWRTVDPMAVNFAKIKNNNNLASPEPSMTRISRDYMNDFDSNNNNNNNEDILL